MIKQWFFSSRNNIPLNNFLPWKDGTKYSEIIYNIESGKYLQPSHILKSKNVNWKGPIILDEKFIKGDFKLALSDKLDDTEENLMPFFFNSNKDDIFINHNINPFDLLTKEQILWIKDNPKLKLVFIDFKESKAHIGPVLKSLPGLEVKRRLYNLKNDCILISNTLSSKKHIDFTKYSIPDWFKFNGAPIIWNWIYHSRQTEEYKSIDCSENLRYNFLCYNGVYRDSRYLLLNRILKEISSEKILYSVNAKYGIREKFTGSANYILPDEYNEIKSLITKTGNLNETYDHNTLKYVDWPDQLHYRECFIDILTESFCERNKYHSSDHMYFDIVFTEKIAKPILCKRPFIVNANQGYLKKLKDFGFKTFDKWLDESYDKDVPVNIQHQIILENIKKINTWSISKCSKVLAEMDDILTHNKNLLEKYLFEDDMFWIKAVTNA